ncbi:hypothetical protein TNCV_4418031 [Trichonephila clavipes]|nr:hypothetical protein TNCV_4418031 [Trichonephila clavipes]
MHLPLIRIGISVKAGSSFVTPAVSSVSFPCRLLSFSVQLQIKKKKQHFPFHCVFGAPRAHFGAVKPPLPALFHSRPRDVLKFRPRSAVFFLQPPPAGGVISDTGLSFILFSAILGISDLFRWHPPHLIFVSSAPKKQTDEGRKGTGSPGSPSPSRPAHIVLCRRLYPSPEGESTGA